MVVENLLDFSIDQICPQLGIGKVQYEDSDESLQNSPEQIHLKSTGAFGEIYIRIAESEDKSEQIITLVGANQNATPVLIVHVNGDESWKEELKHAVYTLKSDPYLCKPESSDI